MNVINNNGIKWQQVAGIGLVCSLAIVGCSRSDNEDSAETTQNSSEQQKINDNASSAPAISCDNPMVQDRLKSALKNTLNQQAQSIAASYANDTQINVETSEVSNKVSNILIDIQNAALLQEANANGITTCQASVSMTLPSEDMYKASQMHTAINKPSLQTRLAQSNIRVNNNMLVDDAFTYVVAAQGGQVQSRIAGQPPAVAIVADVVAGSAFQDVIDERRAIRQEQAVAQRRDAIQQRENDQSIPQPRAVAPVAPIRQATPPTISQGSNQNNSESRSQSSSGSSISTTKAPTLATTPETPKVVPTDNSIDMVIIEEDSATY